MAGRRLLAGVVIALCTVTSVKATLLFEDGNELRDMCRNSRGYALGYVVGMSDYYQFVTSPTLYDYCIPRQAVGNQILDVVCSFLEKHPEKRHEWASGLAVDAMKEAWPCPAQDN